MLPYRSSIAGQSVVDDSPTRSGYPLGGLVRLVGWSAWWVGPLGGSRPTLKHGHRDGHKDQRRAAPPAMRSSVLQSRPSKSAVQILEPETDITKGGRLRTVAAARTKATCSALCRPAPERARVRQSRPSTQWPPVAQTQPSKAVPRIIHSPFLIRLTNITPRIIL